MDCSESWKVNVMVKKQKNGTGARGGGVLLSRPQCQTTWNECGMTFAVGGGFGDHEYDETVWDGRDYHLLCRLFLAVLYSART